MKKIRMKYLYVLPTLKNVSAKIKTQFAHARTPLQLCNFCMYFVLVPSPRNFHSPFRFYRNKCTFSNKAGALIRHGYSDKLYWLNFLNILNCIFHDIEKQNIYTENIIITYWLCIYYFYVTNVK